MITDRALAPLDLTRDLDDAARAKTGEEAINEILRRALDALARIVPYDLATVFRLEPGDRLTVRAGKGALFTPQVRQHTVSLDDFPSIREAIETRRARAFEAHDHTGEGDPFDGVLDFPPGHACMVVPLVAGNHAYGALTLDRAKCERYPDTTVQLVEVYGQVLGLAIQNAEKAEALERLHDSDHAHARLLEAELAGDAVNDASRSPAMRDVLRKAELVAATSTPVLIRGETGTGKERLAWSIHNASPRREQAFVRINCAAIPPSLLEAELFGHTKGAFTGATRDRAGRFQMANGGTILLDEIGELPTELQAKLLRVLQEGTIEPVGSDRTSRIDVRVIAATHVHLERAITDKRFREDLFYRLNVFPIELPPLRERLEDLPRLCEAIMREQARRTGRREMRVSKAGLGKLASYAWPGNIRELANILERATILSPSREIAVETLHLPDPEPASYSKTARDLGKASTARDTNKIEGWPTLEEMQARYIRQVLGETRGRVYGTGGAAEILGMKPSTLQSRMKKLGVQRRD